MPDLSYLEQQQIIDDFIETAERYEWLDVPGWRLVLEKLLIVEKLPIFTEAPQNFTGSPLRNSVSYIVEHACENETALIAAINLLVKLITSEADKINLCALWYNTRDSYLTSLMRVHRWIFPFDIQNNSHIYYGFYAALKFGHRDWLEKFVTEFENLPIHNTPRFYANVLLTKDAEISQAARLLLQRLTISQKQQILEAFTRPLSYSTPLSHIQFLAEEEFYSAGNLKVAVMVGLVRGSFFDRFEENFAVLRVLVKLLAEPEFAPPAEAVLGKLRTKEGQSHLCTLSVLEESNQAERLAVDSGYEPLHPPYRAFFFFLSRQFAKYDDFDFDHSQLRAFYETSPLVLRRQIALAVRQSGNPAYLDILSFKQTLPDVEISVSQSKTVVQVLAATANWAALWQKVLELPFMGSVAALGKLLKSDWQPPTPEETQLYQKLASLLRVNITTTYRLKSGLPPEVYKLLTQPFSAASVQDCTTLTRENNAALTPAVQNLLAYACAILSYRFRYAIELEAICEVEPTKFDIEL